MRGRHIAALAVAACTVTAAWGASANDAGAGPPRTGATADAAGAQGATARPPVNRLGQAVRAVRTAERAIGGKAYDIETDRLRGRRVWEVKVARGVERPWELDVRADGRRVVRRVRAPRITDDVRNVAGARIPMARALRTAASRAPGGTFDEAGIDRVGGRLVWDVEFTRSRDREVEVRVDATTGGVLEVDADD